MRDEPLSRRILSRMDNHTGRDKSRLHRFLGSGTDAGPGRAGARPYRTCGSPIGHKIIQLVEGPGPTLGHTALRFDEGLEFFWRSWAIGFPCNCHSGLVGAFRRKLDGGQHAFRPARRHRMTAYFLVLIAK